MAGFGAVDYVEGVISGVEGSSFSELCDCVAGGVPGVVGGVGCVGDDGGPKAGEGLVVARVRAVEGAYGFVVADDARLHVIEG